jgi:hypothetical protein
VEIPLTDADGAFRVELERLLDIHDEKRRAEAARIQQVKEDERAFLQRFEHARRSIVRPVFEIAVAVLGARGHSASISEQEFSVQADGKATEANISIRVLPAGVEAGTPACESAPALTIATRHYSKAVEIRGGLIDSQSARAAGAHGEYRLEQITSERIGTELLQLIAELLRR